MSNGYTDSDQYSEGGVHPFVTRNVSGELPGKVRALFDNSHYEEAALNAFIYLDKVVQAKSGSADIGQALMFHAFGGLKPPVVIADLSSETGKSEQEGMKFMTAGGVRFVRNPRAHENSMGDSPDACLDYLCFVSMILRELNMRSKKYGSEVP